MKVVLVLVLVLVLDLPRTHADRVSQLAQALDAIHALGATGRDRLERDMYAAARTRCHAEVAPPAPACLADAAAALCRGDTSCEAAADVVATNTRAADDWIDQATRARLVRGAADYRVALFAELHHRFAALAAELALTGGHDAAAGASPGSAGARSTPAGSAESIDRLCRERDRTVHACQDGDASCVPSVPWSRCVAALVWFVGSSP
jgi:hypothetical protein